jgi:hypothetical protein
MQDNCNRSPIKISVQALYQRSPGKISVLFTRYLYKIFERGSLGKIPVQDFYKTSPGKIPVRELYIQDLCTRSGLIRSLHASCLSGISIKKDLCPSSLFKPSIGDLLARSPQETSWQDLRKRSPLQVSVQDLFTMSLGKIYVRDLQKRIHKVSTRDLLERSL